MFRSTSTFDYHSMKTLCSELKRSSSTYPDHLYPLSLLPLKEATTLCGRKRRQVRRSQDDGSRQRCFSRRRPPFV
ncbi:hypothetical protein BDV96DRAFT_580639 [Lophiotrema nucula]|uniref:Uncharacterized protein n=1 Tax=Lophiotrema nucula TaxID=690887 RepID=A0A6A5YZ56_9PLEO|nr:hypothetical protein BDV96DRAFT_580639 [Lophiotrema nucula]